MPSVVNVQVYNVGEVGINVGEVEFAEVNPFCAVKSGNSYDAACAGSLVLYPETEFFDRSRSLRGLDEVAGCVKSKGYLL